MITIAINTQNDKKFEEFKKFFENYPYELKRNSEEADYIIEEETELLGKHNSIGNVTSTLKVIDNTQEKKSEKEFISTQKVLIGKPKGQNPWWDEYVFNFDVLKTFEELSQKGYKNTPRQMNLSKFIKEFYYKDFNFNFLENNFKEGFVYGALNVLDFYMKNISYIEKKTEINEKVKNLIVNGCLMSPGIRIPKNNRLKNYWIPGLNAGIPAIPKDDFIHEITFSLHDVFHQLFPDPIVTIDDERSYVIPRMISEAITMVMSDYYFINEIKDAFPEYNFGKRKIFKVFKEMERNGAAFKDMIKANIYFAVKGDLSIFKKFNVNDEILNPFVEKFKVFFIEDYKWTRANYRRISEKIENFKKLDEQIPIDGDAYKTNAFFKNLDIDGMVNYFYDRVEKYQNNICINLENTNKAFFKGNFFIFLDYDFEEFKVLKDLYLESLLKNNIDDCRFYYTTFINILKDKNLINEDDYHTYKDIYPVFSPFYVFYDKEAKKENSLNEIKNNFKTLKGE